jgi:hypothetical protein
MDTIPEQKILAEQNLLLSCTFLIDSQITAILFGHNWVIKL